MRLLHSKTLQLREFMGDDNVPPYAILSHTWGEDEVTYQDMSISGVKKKTGYTKIEYCCNQATRERLDWVWVDTCCIDKSSSAELSEAINSMFRWYKRADVCYVYLVDVFSNIDLEHGSKEFAGSRWFTRGWTLQELVAPSSMTFFSNTWNKLGTKAQLRNYLSQLTGVNSEVLMGEDLEQISVARRMSWAANRKTTRVEDMAYSLIGIFDVNMPLLYGEGERAFLRLQEEILKVSNDESIFAWGTTALIPTMRDFNPGNLWLHAPKPDVVGSRQRQRHPSGRPLLRGLLADSPAEFASFHNIVIDRSYDGNHDEPPIIFNRSIRIKLPLLQDTVKNLAFAVLGCGIEEKPGLLFAVAMQTWGSGAGKCFGRILLTLIPIDSRMWGKEPIKNKSKLIQVKEEVLALLVRDGCFLITNPNPDSRYFLSRAFCIPSASYDERTRLLMPDKVVYGTQAVLVFKGQGRPTFAFSLGKDLEGYWIQAWTYGDKTIQQHGFISPNLITCLTGGVEDSHAVTERDSGRNRRGVTLTLSWSLKVHVGIAFEEKLWSSTTGVKANFVFLSVYEDFAQAPPF